MAGTDGSNQSKTEIRRLIDIVFAVVIAQSLIEYRTFLFPPKFWELPFWVLLGVYSSIIFSWFSYNTALENNSYLLDSTFGKLRFTTDFAIVLMYAFLLHAISWLRQGLVTVPEELVNYNFNATAAFLAGYTMLFILYVIDDIFVRIAHDQVELAEVLEDLKPWRRSELKIEHMDKSATISLVYLTLLLMYGNGMPSSFMVNPFTSTLVVIFSVILMLFWRSWLEADDL